MILKLHWNQLNKLSGYGARILCYIQFCFTQVILNRERSVYWVEKQNEIKYNTYVLLYPFKEEKQKAIYGGKHGE